MRRERCLAASKPKGIRACSDLCFGFITSQSPPTPAGDRSEQALFIGRTKMTKAEHKQRAMDMAYQVKRCYSKTAKKAMVRECLAELIKSLKVPQ